MKYETSEQCVQNERVGFRFVRLACFKKQLKEHLSVYISVWVCIQ